MPPLPLPEDPELKLIKPGTVEGMFYTAFGEPRPANEEQLNKVLFESGIDMSEAQARIEDLTGEEAPYNGWTAEIDAWNPDTDELEIIGTAAFESRNTLVNALMTAGIDASRIEVAA